MIEARIIDGLCRTYHCLPSALLAEDTSMLLRLNILNAAGPANGPGASGAEDEDFVLG